MGVTSGVGPPPVERANMPRYLSALYSMLKSRAVSHRPFFLAHAVTFGCNSRCQTCTYWKLTPRMKEDLTTPEVYRLIDEGYAAGMRGYYLFGGEPIIRRDIGEIVDHAKNRGFITTMNTNGSLLASKAKKLRNLDFAFVSLDYFDEYDDVIRGRPGTFQEVMRGLEKVREVGATKVILVTTISTLNFDAIRPMAELAQKLGVGISYNSVEPTLDFGLTKGFDDSPNLDLGLSRERLAEFYRTLLTLKREGYPLIETETVLRDFVAGRPWRCHFPKMFVYVSPNQTIYTCRYDYSYDLRQGSFEEYFSSPQFREHVARAESCNVCVRTCVRGYSYAYDFKPRNLVGLFGDARRLFHQVGSSSGAASPGAPSQRNGPVAPTRQPADSASAVSP